MATANIGKTAASAGKAAEKSAGGMSKFASSIARIAKYRLIRSVIRGIVDGIKEGATNFYNFSKATGDTLVGFQSALNSTKAAASQMKNQLGAAFGTLYAQIAPIINNLIAIVIKLANVLTMLFARLGGADGWYRAADGANAAADAASGAGQAAKEAMKYLAPFDELNRLHSKNQGGGGGGGGSSGGGGGNYEWVPFEKFDLGDGIASFFDTIKDIFNGAAEWIESVDWQNLASNIVTGISDALSKVDWAGVTQAIARFLGAAIGAVAGFVWGAITDLVTAIRDGIYNAFHNDDGTTKTGEEIVNGILNGVINAITGIGTWIYDNVFTPFINGFKKAFGIASPAKEMEGPGEMIGQGILEGIKKPFVAIGEWLNANVLKPIKDFFSGNTDMNGLTLAIKTDLSGFKLPDLTAFKTAWDKIKNKTVTLNAKLKGASANTVSKLSSAWSAITTKVSTLTASIKKDFSDVVLTNIKNAWDGITKKTVTLTANLSASKTVTSFITAWNALKDKALELKASIADNVKAAWNKAAQAWNNNAILSKLGKLPLLANGGILQSGQLFIARESGPEIVGNFGNQTGVLNNQQIVDAVSKGVASAIASINFSLAGVPSINSFGDGGLDEETLFNAMLRALNAHDPDGGNNVTVELDGREIYNSVVSRNKKEIFRTGVNPMMARA